MGTQAATIITDDYSDIETEIDELQDCLQELDDTDAQLLSFHYVEGLSCSEIGELLQISDITARQMYSDAVENLRVVRNRRR